MKENEVEAYLSPRYQLCPPEKQMIFKDSEGEELAKEGTICLKMIDTKREREIAVGVGWPYKKLAYGECIISS